MTRWLGTLLSFCVLSLASVAPAADIKTSIQRLREGEDFRMRVQAALDLGKSKDSQARVPLENALDDQHGAVRAAAAAALKVLGDKAALPALRARKNDSSSSVRTQIKSSIAALEGSSAGSRPRVLIKVGPMKNGTSVRSTELVGALEQTSRLKLAELPGVEVVEPDSDVNKLAKKKRLPAILLTGRIRTLNAERDGRHVVYSASVEYIVHRMPEQSLMGTVSGSASARASPEEARDKKRSADIRSQVLEAAVASAMRRASEAFSAAVR